MMLPPIRKSFCHDDEKMSFLTKRYGEERKKTRENPTASAFRERHSNLIIVCLRLYIFTLSTRRWRSDERQTWNVYEIDLRHRYRF